MTSDESFILYSYFRSGASYRVRIALHLKDIDFKINPVHLLKEGGAQHADEYRSLNPSGDVPTLIYQPSRIDQPRVIGQSMAILHFLDSLRPAVKLFPGTAYEQALVIQACEILNSGSQPLFNLRVLQKLEREHGLGAEAKEAWARDWVVYGLKAFGGLIGVHSGAYCFGNEPTAADCFLVPHLTSARRFKVDLSPFPRLLEIEARCKELRAFQLAAPEAQPDFEPS
jgi:maleylacetoacetate isomerase